MLQPVRVLAIAPVLGPARGLHVSGLPGAWPERAQRRRRVKGAGSHFQIIGLQDHAALPCPEGLEGQNEVLKGARWTGRTGPYFVCRASLTLHDLTYLPRTPLTLAPLSDRRHDPARRTGGKAKP